MRPSVALGTSPRACRLRTKTALAPLPAAAPAEDPQHHQQQYRADGGRGDRTHHSRTDVDAEAGQQPGADEGADDADYEVADQPEPCPSHELPGEPAGDDTDHHDDEKPLVGDVHAVLPAPKQCSASSRPHAF